MRRFDALNEIVAKRPRWGFWKCYARLRADGHRWNHKRVHRVYCGMRLNLQRKAKKRFITREPQPLLLSTELNRVWALDFMRDTLYDGRPFRTLNVIDEGNREALRIECGTSIPATRVVRVLNQLVEVYGKPEAIRLDNVLNASRRSLRGNSYPVRAAYADRCRETGRAATNQWRSWFPASMGST